MVGGWFNSYGYKHPRKMRLGAAIWLCSNVFLVGMGVLLKLPLYTAMMLYFTWTSWRGFINNKETT